MTGSESRWSPDLALDLEGGTQIILTPVTDDGSEITAEDISQAIEIIRQRVDASGVAEAEITSQGGSNIVVGLPGTPSEETLDLVRTSAVLRLRAVIDYTEQVLATRGLETVYGPDGEVTEEQLARARQLADLDGDGTISTEPAQAPESASADEWITEDILVQAMTLDCTSESARVQNAYSQADKPVVACVPATGASYILGPAELDGSHIDQASSGPRVNEMGQTIGGWQVNMDFTGEGGDLFGEVTTRLAGYPYGTAKNLFAIVLDGSIISVASLQAPILGGSASISGSFTAPEAASLANQLSFGSLPLTFEVQSEEQISATLGSEQLVNSLIAGAVGAGLIVLYLLWQYQGLGVLAIMSITAVMGISYLTISLLSWTIGYRLSLAGVVGLIISIGISADSFIVYFERIRDEIREGRTLKDAVEYGWTRARQTILVSDAVNLVAATVLYFLAVGSVRGFAFTLGLTTVIDVIVVFLFTYPVVKLLVRTTFFGQGHRLSGMSAASLGADPVYAGRGRIRDTGVSKSQAKAAKKKAARAAAAARVAAAERAEPAASVDTLERETKTADDKASGTESRSTRGEKPMTLAQRKAAQRRAEKEEE
nr:protein translocase subunit SecD [Flaviflexus huanghaiensis]